MEITRTRASAMLIITVLAYQNFDFSNLWQSATQSKVQEMARQNHARELLGKDYKKSYASKAETVASLSAGIYKEVSRMLPKKHKNKAAAVATTIIQEANRYEMDPVFVMAIIKTESMFNPEARGGAGETAEHRLDLCPRPVRPITNIPQRSDTDS